MLGKVCSAPRKSISLSCVCVFIFHTAVIWKASAYLLLKKLDAKKYKCDESCREIRGPLAVCMWGGCSGTGRQSGACCLRASVVPAGGTLTCISPASPAVRPLRGYHGKGVIQTQQSGNKRREACESYLGKIQTLLGQASWPAESEECSLTAQDSVPE